MHLNNLQRVGAMNLAELYLQETQRDRRLQSFEIPVANGTHYIIGGAFCSRLEQDILDALCAGARCLDITLHDRAGETMAHYLSHRQRFERTGTIPPPPEEFPLDEEAIEIDLHHDPLLDPVDLGKLVRLLQRDDEDTQALMAEIAFERVHRRILGLIRQGHLAFHIIVPKDMLYLMWIHRTTVADLVE